MTSLNKTLTVLVTAIAALGVSQVASADPTLVLNLGTYNVSPGGEFTATSSLPGAFGLQGYVNGVTGVVVGTSVTSFDTFCVQAGDDDVTFSPGSRYAYSYSDEIIGGPSTFSPSDPRLLNIQVAWLYGQFASGKLATDTGGAFSYTSASDAGVLQDEIWFLEGEDASGSSSIYSGLIAPITGTFTPGEFGVDVLNLWNYTTVNGVQVIGSAAQNQLVYNNGGFNTHGHPIPDNGLTIALIGVSFLGLALFRRKSVKA
jgi:hypothetical protein